MKGKFTLIIAVIMITALFLSTACASYQSFTVPAGNTQQVTINLNEGDTITGTVSVSGGSGNDVNFRASDPHGNSLEYRDRTSYCSFSFQASTSGTYTLSFDNSFSYFSSKSVSLDYSIQSPTPPPVFGGLGGGSGGLSYLLIVGIIAAVILVVVIVVVVLVIVPKRSKDKTSYPPPPPPPPSF